VRPVADGEGVTKGVFSTPGRHPTASSMTHVPFDCAPFDCARFAIARRIFQKWGSGGAGFFCLENRARWESVADASGSLVVGAGLVRRSRHTPCAGRSADLFERRSEPDTRTPSPKRRAAYGVCLLRSTRRRDADFGGDQGGPGPSRELRRVGPAAILVAVSRRFSRWRFRADAGNCAGHVQARNSGGRFPSPHRKARPWHEVVPKNVLKARKKRANAPICTV